MKLANLTGKLLTEVDGKSTHRRQLVFILIMAFVLFGCTAQPQEIQETVAPTVEPPAQKEVTQAPIEISIGATNLLTERNLWTELLESQVALFEESHPHIKINLVAWGWDPSVFAEDIAAGEVPDVMEIAATEGSLVIDNGYVADITDMWEEWKHSDAFNVQILSSFTRDGRIYGVPVSIYIMGLFYDKTLFEEAGLVDQTGEAVPPTTWNEFTAAAVAIKENTSAAGFCILTQNNQGGWNFVNWGWQAGGSFEQQIDGEWFATFDEPPIVEAMTFMKDLRWEHDVFQEDLVLEAPELIDKLGNHECGMAFMAPDWFQGIAIDDDLDEFGLTKLPTGPGGDANLMGGAFHVIRSDLSPEQKQAAFDWITWFTFDLEALENDLRSEVGRNHWAFLNRSLMFQVNSPISIAERELLDKYRSLPYFTDYIEFAGKYARTEPPVATQEMYAALDQVLWEVLNNEDADPQALLTEAAEQFQIEYLDR